MRANVRVDFLRRHEQLRRAVRMEQREGKRDRRAAHVLSTDVEGPGDRIECGEHDRVEPLRLQPVDHRGALLRRGFAREGVAMWHEARVARRGLVRPDRIDRIGIDCHQSRVLRC